MACDDRETKRQRLDSAGLIQKLDAAMERSSAWLLKNLPQHDG
eukprot:gene8738-817_t